MKKRRYSCKDLQQMSYGSLSLSFIRQYADYLDWRGVCTYTKLPEDFIDEFIDKIDFKAICEHQILSENFISKHADKLCWFRIIRNQKLSKKFYIKNLLKIIKMIKKFNPKNECNCIRHFERNSFNF